MGQNDESQDALGLFYDGTYGTHETYEVAVT